MIIEKINPEQLPGEVLLHCIRFQLENRVEDGKDMILGKIESKVLLDLLNKVLG